MIIIPVAIKCSMVMGHSFECNIRHLTPTGRVNAPLKFLSAVGCFPTLGSNVVAGPDPLGRGIDAADHIPWLYAVCSVIRGRLPQSRRLHKSRQFPASLQCVRAAPSGVRHHAVVGGSQSAAYYVQVQAGDGQ